MNKKKMNEEIRKIVNRDIILKHLFLESLDEKYGDEYIRAKYRISASKIRTLYSYICENEDIKELEDEIKDKINSGEIDLKKEAINWHKESFRRVIKSSNDDKEEER